MVNDFNNQYTTSNDIDAWKEIQKQLLEAEGKYQSIFNNHHTPMLIIDSESGDIVDANSAAVDYYGYFIEQLLNLKISDLNILSKNEINIEMELARLERRKWFSFKHKMSNGEIRAVEVYSGPINIKNKSLLFSIIHDVQEKSEFKKNLKIQESYFKELFENSPEAIAILDNDFNIIKVNKSFERIFLYECEKIEKENITRVLCEETFYNESKYFKDCVNKGNFVRKDTLRKRKDGKLIEVSILGYPITSDGAQIGVYCIYSDLSLVKEMERKNRARLQRYLSLLKGTIDSIPDIIAVINPDLTIELMNTAGCKYFNISYEKIKGLYWNVLIEDKFGEEDKCILTSLETNKEFYTQYYLKNIDKYIDWFCKPITDEQGNIILFVERIKDITKEKKYEEELRLSKEKAIEANKLKTEFLANMSHEIRTPMNGVIGLINMLEDTQLSKEQIEYIEMLKYSEVRLLAIINDILDVSKIEAGKFELNMEQFNLNKLIDKVVKYFKLQAEVKGLRFVSSNSCDPEITLLGDEDRLNQILFNLLINAVKFTQKGYIIFDVMLVNEYDNKAEIKFSICDTGIGIEKDMIGSLFQNFKQLDSSSNKKYPGTGLGLALSSKLVELMEGKLSVESDYGFGSIFSFTLTFDVAPPKNTLSNNVFYRNDEVPDVLRGLKILVGEDENINQIIIKNMLEKLGCSVTIAQNGKEVLTIVNMQPFDMILMDIFMPEIDGYEVTKRIRDEESITCKHIPIIALTAVALKDERDNCLKAGMDEFVTKPVKKEDIIKVIVKMLNLTRRNTEFCINTMKDRLGIDNEVLRHIINEIIGEDYRVEFLGKIQNYLEEKDYEKLSKHIHKFKGSLSHFENNTINDLLKEIRENINLKNYTNLEVIVQELTFQFNNFTNSLIMYQENL